MSLSDKDREWIQKAIAEAFTRSSPPKKKKKHGKKNAFKKAFKNCSGSLWESDMPSFHGYPPPPNLHSMSLRGIEESVRSLNIPSQIPEDMIFNRNDIDIDENPYKL